MGIYLTLSQQGEGKVPMREVVLSRLHYTVQAIRFFYQGRVFVPYEILVWKGRPSEALGGEQIEKITVNDFDKDISALVAKMSEQKLFPLEQLLATIIQINGTWNIDDTQLDGFFSANNSASWRSVYHDLEIDAFGKGEIEDLTDVFWKDKDLQGVIKRFIDSVDNARVGQKVMPREIFFSVGVPAKGEVGNLRALHCSQRRYLIDFMYSTLSENNVTDIHDKLGPLNKKFFIGAIANEKIVNDRLINALNETLITETVGNSVTYLAKDKDSFTKLYNKLFEDVFKPAFKNLPNANEVKEKIVTGLSKMEQTHL
jgi:hypothetical protein